MGQHTAARWCIRCGLCYCWCSHVQWHSLIPLLRILTKWESTIKFTWNETSAEIISFQETALQTNLGSKKVIQFCLWGCQLVGQSWYSVAPVRSGSTCMSLTTWVPKKVLKNSEEDLCYFFKSKTLQCIGICHFFFSSLKLRFSYMQVLIFQTSTII